MKGITKIVATLIMITSLLLCCIGCPSSASPHNSPNHIATDKTPTLNSEPTPKNSNTFELTEPMKETLSIMCYTIPNFSKKEQQNDTFMRDFLFLTYTGGTQTGTIKKNNLLFVKDSDAESLIELVFGTPYDVAKLIYTKDNSYCYYLDGFLVILPSDYSNVEYVFSDMRHDNDHYSVIFDIIIENGTESSGTHTINIIPANNKNGFIVCGSLQNVIL